VGVRLCATCVRQRRGEEEEEEEEEEGEDFELFETIAAHVTSRHSVE